WLSKLEGLPEGQWCFPPGEIKEGVKLPADWLQRTGYRLPTSHEWECACRAGTVTSRSYGSADALLPHYAWYKDNSRGRTRPVGALKPNDFGLFDMHGNLWEWCMDTIFFSPEVEERVLRGGYFGDPLPAIRTARSGPNGNRATFKENSAGMRIARTLPAARR